MADDDEDQDINFPTALPGAATEQLHALLRDQGLATERDGDVIATPALGPAPGLRFTSQIIQELKHAIQLDVVTMLWPGRGIAESLTGVGRGQPARSDAVAAFAAGPMPVILEAFGAPQGDKVQRATWTIAGQPFEVILGPFNVRGTAANETAWFPQFRAFVERTPMATGVHWIRVSYAQLDGERATLDITRDNDPWPEAVAALDRAAWPTGKGLVTVRLFLLVRAGLDISLAAALMAGRDDDAAIAALGADGVSLDAARRAVAWLPLAFGRELLSKMGVKTTRDVRIITETDREPVSYALDADPMYRAAADHAARLGKLGPVELFKTIALRSPEVRAVNQALNDGAKAADLSLAAPVMRLVR